VTGEPELEKPALEGADQEPAAPAKEGAKQLAGAAPPAEPPARELTLVYEINADEYFPADIELEADYPERPETRQLRAPVTAERVDGTPLPYEGPAQESGPATGESEDVDDSPAGMKETEGNPKIEEKKSKSTDQSESAQLRLPRMEQ
jgi:hypothetical protein